MTRMVQLDMKDLNLISRTIDLVKSKGLPPFASNPPPAYYSTSASPSKSSSRKQLGYSHPSSNSYSNPYHHHHSHSHSPSHYDRYNSYSINDNDGSGRQRASPPPSSPSWKSSDPPQDDIISQLVDYPMTPVPSSPPLPAPLGCCMRWCCGGNMKWIGFPMLCAISLGLFLAFSKAATSGMATDRDYNRLLNSRQLSDDDVDLPVPPGQGLIRHRMNDHMLIGQTNFLLNQRHADTPCDCTLCDAQEALFYPTETAYKKLVKHSLQHFYGKREIAANIASFVPFKHKLWDLGFALYTTASDQCQGLAKPEAVVLVMSEATHKEKRQAVRRTWGSVARRGRWPHRRMAGDVRVIFVMGVSNTQSHNELVTQEAEGYGDVILVDVPAGAEGASKRVLSGFKWVQMYCPQTQYVIKVNEDVFLDLPRLLSLLANQEMANMIYGPIVASKPVPREHIQTDGVSVSYHAYLPEWFPPYAEKHFYALSTELSKHLLEVAEFIRYVSLDDVFVTGILGKVFDVRHLNVPASLFDRLGRQEVGLCDFVFQSKMAIKAVAPETAHSMWRRIERQEMCGLSHERL